MTEIKKKKGNIHCLCDLGAVLGIANPEPHACKASVRPRSCIPSPRNTLVIYVQSIASKYSVFEHSSYSKLKYFKAELLCVNQGRLIIIIDSMYWEKFH